MKQKNSTKGKFAKKIVQSIAVTMILCMMITISGVLSTKTVDAATIKISASSTSLKVGKTKKLSLKGTTKKAVWSSSNKKVATVGKSTGKVKAISAGNATITATLNGKKYRCKVTVKALTPKENLDLVLSKVKKAYGDNYRPNMALDKQYFKSLFGLAEDDYDAFIGEMPMISAHVDTFIGIHAASGKKSTVEAAVKKYQKMQIEEVLQYPSNLTRIKASKVVVVGDYVFYIVLGELTDAASSESEVIKFYEAQNQIAVDAINSVLNK